ncbi:GIY-YIG nuclease family protein [Chitinophagaceae bacterium LWZ2-11]
MKRGGSVYIVTNELRTVLYTGVTSDLMKRILEHKNKIFERSFTAKYNCIYLVYFQNFPTITEAILEEKRIKAGSRIQKMNLINSVNPYWLDLWEDI